MNSMIGSDILNALGLIALRFSFRAPEVGSKLGKESESDIAIRFEDLN